MVTKGSGAQPTPELSAAQPFTPGPWSVSWVQWPKGQPIGFAIRPALQPTRNAKRGVSIASLNCAEPGITALSVYTQEELEANARLMAAAPEMYQALRGVALIAGNLSDEAVEGVGGINDARSRALMVTSARKLARAALALAGSDVTAK